MPRGGPQEAARAGGKKTAPGPPIGPLPRARFFMVGRAIGFFFGPPVLGLKADCLAGRVGAVDVIFNSTGLLMGQCSELCGVLHSFMPVTLFFL